jgi:hypothetical protein
VKASLEQKVEGQLSEALKNAVDVKDERYKFY